MSAGTAVNPGTSTDRNRFEGGGMARLDGTFGFVVYGGGGGSGLMSLAGSVCATS